MPEPEFPVRSWERERTKHQWNENGFKKLEEVLIETKLGHKRVSVVFNSKSGEFGANAAEMHFQSKDYQGLLKAVAAHFNKVESVEFTRHISVDFDIRRESHRRGYGSKSWSGHDEDRGVSGIQLEFDVYDVSNVFDTATYKYKGQDSARVRIWRLLERQDDGTWSAAGKDEQRNEDSYGGIKQMIPFTEERLQTFLSLKAGLTRIASTLHEMFNEKALESGKAALLLDGLETQKLLPAPPPQDVSEKPKKKGRSR